MIGYGLSFANVVVDKKTGLMWQDNTEAKSVKKVWSEAKEYCENLTLEGHDDWFLPTYEQLLTIVDKSRRSPAINKNFKNTASAYYWSSSEDKSFNVNAWYVGFSFGYSYDGYKTHNNYVRCARKE